MYYKSYTDDSRRHNVGGGAPTLGGRRRDKNAVGGGAASAARMPRVSAQTDCTAGLVNKFSKNWNEKQRITSEQFTCAAANASTVLPVLRC